MQQMLLDTDNPNIKRGWRNNGDILQTIQVETQQTGLDITGNVEVRTYTETTTILFENSANED